MSALPVTPMATPPPDVPPLSEGARIVDTFIAPSKTFTDLRRSAAWWGPFLLMAIFSLALVYLGGQKVGFRKLTENQLRAQPKQEEALDKLPPAEREQHMETAANITRTISYVFPVIQLVILVIIAAVLFATFKFAAGADLKFKTALAIVMYAGLPGLLRAAIAIVSLLAGASPDTFTFQNPIASNPGFFMDPASSPALYGIASAFDIFLIWTLILTAIGFTCVSKVKRGTAMAIVFGWWLFFTLAGAGLAAAFS